MEQPVHDGGAAGVGQKLALVADQAAGRRMEDEPQPSTAGRPHLDHLGLALGHLLHHDAGMLLVEIDDDLLDGLHHLASRAVELDQHPGTRHAELVTLAAHRLDQDAELQFAAARHFHGVLLVGLGDAQRHVAFRLAQQPVADHAAR